MWMLCEMNLETTWIKLKIYRRGSGGKGVSKVDELEPKESRQMGSDGHAVQAFMQATSASSHGTLCLQLELELEIQRVSAVGAIWALCC